MSAMFDVALMSCTLFHLSRGSAVAIIIPSILHLVTFVPRRNGLAKAWLICKDVLIMMLGFLAFTTGTYFSMHDIWNRIILKESHGHGLDGMLNSTDANVTLFTNFTTTLAPELFNLTTSTLVSN